MTSAIDGDEPNGTTSGTSFIVINVGDSCSVSGLSQAVHLNGKKARVVGYNATKGLWHVLIDGQASQLALRPENLIPHAPAPLKPLVPLHVLDASTAMMQAEQGKEEESIPTEQSASAGSTRWYGSLCQHPCCRLPVVMPAVVVGRTGREYGGLSLNGLAPDQQPRRRAIAIVESRFFEPLILSTIVANCVSLAMNSPIDPCCTSKAFVIGLAESIFLLIFTVELFLKVLAYGFITHKT